MKIVSLVICLLFFSSSSYSASITSLNLTNSYINIEDSVGSIFTIDIHDTEILMNTPGMLTSCITTIFGCYYLSSVSDGLSANIENNTMLIDISNLQLFWKFDGYGLVPTSPLNVVTNLYDNYFTLDFESIFTGGEPLEGVTNVFHLEGTYNVSAVPVPSSIFLFISGLLLLIRQKKHIKTS